MTKKTIPLVDYLPNGQRLVIGEATLEEEDFKDGGPGGGISVKLTTTDPKYKKLIGSEGVDFSVGPGFPPSEASLVASADVDVRTPFQKAIDKLGLKEKHG